MDDKINYSNIVLPQNKKIDRKEVTKFQQEINAWSGDDFENFLLEWLKYCKKDIDENSQIYKIGGTGDKGIDIYYKNSDKLVYYQAKNYSKNLTKSQVIDIIIKIYWYIFKEKINKPDEIYIVATKNLNTDAAQLLTNQNKKNIIIESAEQSLKNNKIDCKKELTDFKKELNKYDFSEVDYLDINDIILDYYNSDLGGIRFKKESIAIPRKDYGQVIYEDKLFYKQLVNITLGEKKREKILNEAKDDYYSSLCLKETNKYLFGDDVEFNKAMNEIYGKINMLFYIDSDPMPRFAKTLYTAANANINNSLLGNQEINLINPSDKKGICHMLVDDEKIRWENE